MVMLQGNQNRVRKYFNHNDIQYIMTYNMLLEKNTVKKRQVNTVFPSFALQNRTPTVPALAWQFQSSLKAFGIQGYPFLP